MSSLTLNGAATDGEQELRVKSAEGVRTLVVRAIQAQSGKGMIYRAIADAYDRMPPDTLAELEEDGLGWTTSVDWGGLEAGIDDAAESILNLITEPAPLVRFHSDAEMQDKAKILADVEIEYSKTLKRWPEYEDVNTLLAHYISAYGVGIPYFPYPNSWQYQAIHPIRLALPKNAKINPETWPWVGIQTEFELTDLVNKLGAGEKATKAGWNIDAIKAAIEKWNESNGSVHFGEGLTEQIVHGFSGMTGSGYADESMTITGYVVYVKEFDGKISEYYLTDQPETDFLFKREKHYDAMTDLVPIIPLSLGDGYFHKLRGYGQKALPYHDMENRMLNHTVDVTMLSSNITLQSDEDVLQRLPELVFGPITILPEDWSIPQQQIQNVTGQLMELRSVFRDQKAGYNKAMGGSIDRTQRSDQSATAARLEYQENSSLRDSQVARIYRRLTIFHRALWKRFNGTITTQDRGYKEQYDFCKRVATFGASKEFLKSINEVTARTIFGDGDPRNIFLALMDLMPFVGFMSEGGKRKFAEWVLKARLRNTDMVNEFLGEPMMDDYDAQQRKWAQLENAAFQSSDVRISAGPRDNHMIHAGEHTVFAEDTISQVEGGQVQMEQGYPVLLKYQEHMTAGEDGVGHLEALQADPLSKPVYQDAYNRYQSIVNTMARYAQMLQAKREAEQQEQMEAMRNPPPDPASVEAAKTEEYKRFMLDRESNAKIERDDKATNAQIQRDDFRAQMDASRRAGEVTPLRNVPKE